MRVEAAQAATSDVRVHSGAPFESAVPRGSSAKMNLAYNLSLFGFAATFALLFALTCFFRCLSITLLRNTGTEAIPMRCSPPCVDREDRYLERFKTVDHAGGRHAVMRGGGFALVSQLLYYS